MTEKKELKAILIDPEAKTVSAVAYDGNFRSIYRLIRASTFTMLQASAGEALYLDDEGLLKPNPGPFFMWKGYPQPLAGCGLLVGISPEGEDRSTKFTIPEVWSRVSWPSVRFTGFEDSTETINHPVLGKNIPVFKRLAQFEPLEASKKKEQ